ncbi:hypothetical protein JL721_3635 [Aureococcus anophagefferens]|nr:hypothetical protein JL721_3635 [Aureococcus anophagefferens]
MPLTITHEGVAYDLDDVDLQWTLEECRGALAGGGRCASSTTASGSCGDGETVEGERLTLAALGVGLRDALELVRVDGGNRPPGAAAAAPAPTRKITCRLTRSSTSTTRRGRSYQGLRSRLRADAANRELAAIPEERRHDALRAVYGAVNDMLDADATDRSLTVGDVDVTVLIVDD